MNKLFIDFLAEELKNNKLIVFVGAGASIDSNLPSWNNLVKIFAEKLGYHNETFSNDELINIPEEYYKRFGKIPYYRILENVFSKKFFPNPIHEALEKLDFNYIITTNFDTLIEDALNKNCYYDVIKKDEDLAHTVNSKMIIKMHGDLTNKNIVLKKSDFNNYEEKFPLISTFIKGLFTTNTVLFIGYSLNDLNVKNMISWIKGILKDDFRKVYLVDFNRTSNSDDEIINKIILPDLEKEEYLGQKEKELLKNKGKLLTDFLEDLYKAKNKKIEEENYLIYSKLDYLTKFNIKDLFKIYIDWDIDDEGNISYKTINEINNEKVNLSKIKKYSEILAKSNVEVKDTKITDFIKDSDSFFKSQEKLDIVLEHIFKFNKDGFEKFLSENEELNNENLIISGYIFFGEYTKARELLNTKLNKLQISNDKERILWTYFILEKLQLIDSRSKDSKNINLKKIYTQYFKVKTLLFEEIINWRSLEENFKKINNSHERFKRNMYSSQFGETVFLIRDIYNFLLKNGIPINFSEIKSVTKKYVEMLFIAYKNDNFSLCIKIKEFNYYDYFFMILLPDDSLIDLCLDHNINKFCCKNEILKQLINTFRNLLELLDLKSINLSPFRNPLKNILFLFYKHNLKEEEFCEIIKIMIESNKFEIFFIEGRLYSELQECFLGILEKNQNYLSENILEKVLDQIIESKKETNLTVIEMITYYYSKIISKKLEITDNLSEYFSKNKEEIKLCFLRLLQEQIKKKEVEKIKVQLKTNFNLNIYTGLLKFDYIDFDLELEDKIIPYLDSSFKEQNSINYDSILYEIFSINNKISQELKEKLKNYNNPYFLNYLKRNNLENNWNYFVARENFDYSKFTIENLKSFTKYGVEKIISEGKNNKEFMKLIYDYLNSNTNNHIFKGYFNYSFKEIKDLDR